ncbi:MAG: DUF1724 domain-containing protein [Methanobrevibacter sp.]|nr:DUF1724 domain-containing protein [Methanobrevibacter sp.]
MRNLNSGILEKFDCIRDDLKFLTNSEIRLDIVSSINNAPKQRSVIQEITNLSYSSISFNIKKLEKKGFVKCNYQGYVVNNITYLFYKQLIDFNRSLSIANRINSFLQGNLVDGIDEESLKELNVLHKCKLLESSITDIYKAQEDLINKIEKSYSLNGVIAFIHPDFPAIFQDILLKGGNLNLLIFNDIYREFLHSFNRDTLKKYIKNGNLKVNYLDMENKIFLIFSNDYLYLGLFKEDNTFDQNRLLYCEGIEGVSWGKRLFNRMYDNSIQIKGV